MCEAGQSGYKRLSSGAVLQPSIQSLGKHLAATNTVSENVTGNTSGKLTTKHKIPPPPHPSTPPPPSRNYRTTILTPVLIPPHTIALRKNNKINIKRTTRKLKSNRISKQFSTTIFKQNDSWRFSQEEEEVSEFSDTGGEQRRRHRVTNSRPTNTSWFLFSMAT